MHAILNNARRFLSRRKLDALLDAARARVAAIWSAVSPRQRRERLVEHIARVNAARVLRDQDVTTRLKTGIAVVNRERDELRDETEEDTEVGGSSDSVLD